MATKGTVSSADFQPQGEMTDMARPPVRPGSMRRGKRRSKRKARK